MIRRIAGAPAAFLVILLAAFLTLWAVPAQAHDEMVSSNPADGDELDSAPGWLEMEFSADLEQVGSQIEVLYDGQDVSAGEITVEGTKVTSALPDDLQPGDYTVKWRVVSSDGHPISGEYAFTLTDAAAGGGEETGDAGLGGEAVDNPGAEVPERGALGDSEGEASGLSLPTTILIAVGALSVLVAVVVIFMRKSKALDNGTRDNNSTDGGASD